MPDFTPEQRERFRLLGIPYVCLEAEELDLYDRLLEEYQPALCLEWGAGWSTIYFPNQHGFIQRWVAVEHDVHWVFRVRERGIPRTVDLCRAEGEDYVWAPFEAVEVGERYDWITIDGVQRGACVLAASRLLAPGGRCLVHDTGRAAYVRWFRAFDQYEVLVEGTPTGRGITLLWNE